jgi:F0F1-type ATP synthase membrane subunit c/vacuolar-type H+-ATPase subunit K
MTTLFKKTPILLSLFIISFFFLIQSAFAQNSTSSQENNVAGEVTLGIAKIVDIKEKDVKDGAIISASEKGSILSNIPYDAQVIGVVARDAAILLNASDDTSGIPVISNGRVYVLVSSKDGKIKKGDLLATSTIPGTAVKAVKSGYVLGTALENYDNPDPKKTDKIVVELNLHYFNAKSTFPGSLTDIFKIALLSTKEGPAAIFKYTVAAIVVLGSFVLGFMSFGRTAAKGIEALGRNPAASRIIHLGIIFNVGIVVVIVLAGLTVAFLILRL